MILAPLAWFGAQICRAEIGDLVPLSTNIDLRQGHVRTAPFRIRIDSAYEIHALVAVKDGGPRSIALEWSLSRGGTNWSAAAKTCTEAATGWAASRPARVSMS